MENKRILIISPEKWGIMKLSKHHYAIELSDLGYEVFFLNPPSLDSKIIQIRKDKEYSSISIIDYYPFSRAQRFLPDFVYCFLVKIQMLFILKYLNTRFYLILNFTSNFFMIDFNKYGKNLYLPFDFVNSDKVKDLARYPKGIISISNGILDQFLQVNKKKLLLNHGLSKYFVQISNDNLKRLNDQKQLGIPKDKKRKLKIGYVGNLMNVFLDKKTVLSLIETHIEVDFNFWGGADLKGNNLGSWSEENQYFLNHIKQFKNVNLMGASPPEELAYQIQSMDVFLICYDIAKYKEYDGSNSHKILEYLSTGKVVVSNYIPGNNFDKDIVVMSNNIENTDYLEIFNMVLGNIEYYNSIELQCKRIEIALNNSYKFQLSKLISFTEEI